MPGTVHVVDDDDSARKAVSRLLSVCGYQVRPYEAGQQLLDATFDRDTTEPACILLDLQMPGLNGLQTFERLAQADHPPVVFISAHGDVKTCASAMKQGALDFLEKPVDAERLTSVVDHALAQDAATQAARLETARHLRRIENLTRREREILTHVISGRLNKVIAGDLAISEKTVKVHRARVLQKLQVRSVAELARICAMLGVSPARGALTAAQREGGFGESH